jgi:aldose 1-epimerase
MRESSTSINDQSSKLPQRENFQGYVDGKKTDLYYLNNKNNMQAAITNYGGRLAALLFPDEAGCLIDVIVGFDSLSQFIESNEPYFNAVIGRYGNRIANGNFELDNVKYSLTRNNGNNTLHGGKKGFQYVVWDSNQIDEQTLELKYFSKDGEEGFPGNLYVTVTYKITDDDELKIEYSANTDKKTVVNLTNHAYFNLNGNNSGNILNHSLHINAHYYTPVDETLIPLGPHEPVEGTPFDFSKPCPIGLKIDEDNVQLRSGKGYDHNFVLDREGEGLKLAATVLGEKSKVFMEVFTEEPGLQFYSGNFMKGENTIKSGFKDEFRTAFALETQHFPDSPNLPLFPTTILSPEDIYRTTTSYHFSIRK